MSKIVGNGKYGLRVIFSHPSMNNNKDRDTIFWFTSENARDLAYKERNKVLKEVKPYVRIMKLKR